VTLSRYHDLCRCGEAKKKESQVCRDCWAASTATANGRTQSQGRKAKRMAAQAIDECASPENGQRHIWAIDDDGTRKRCELCHEERVVKTVFDGWGAFSPETLKLPGMGRKARERLL